MKVLDIKCPFCGRHYDLVMPEKELLAWQGGELVQNCTPSLSTTERESLISGICPKCQEKIFGQEDTTWIKLSILIWTEL